MAGLLRILARYATGQPMTGNRKTDATFFSRATTGEPGYWGRGEPSRWSMAPGWQKAAVRLAPAATVAGWHADTGATEWSLVVAGGTGAGLAAARGIRAVRTAAMRRVTVPLGLAAAPILDLPDLAARRAVTLRPGYAAAREGEIGSVALPERFRAAPDQRRALEHLILSRLPVDADFSWKTAERPGRVAIMAAPSCPPMVPFADLLDEMGKCKRGQVVIGLDRHESVYRGSFLIDDPHWGFSVGSGRGKSTFLQLTAAQILRQDPAATVTGIDPKMVSLTPLLGIRGVVIANDPREMGEWDRDAKRCFGGMWGAVDDFRAEMMRRLDMLRDDPTAEFPIALLILDEANQFSAQTATAWRAVRDPKLDEPAPPPWRSIASIHWMGRQVSCHCVMVGQRLDDRATGGIGLRSAIGFVGMAGYRQKEWDLLIGTRPMPRAQKPKGRWIYDDHDDQTWVQNICASRDPVEAGVIIREYAMAGRGPVRDGCPDSASPGITREPRTDIDARWVVGLAAAADHLGLSPAAFEKRRQRAGGTVPGESRRGNQPAWIQTDLTRWAGGADDPQDSSGESAGDKITRV